MSRDLDTFELDPANTDYQRGDKAALEQMYSLICVAEGWPHD